MPRPPRPFRRVNCALLEADSLTTDFDRHGNLRALDFEAFVPEPWCHVAQPTEGIQAAIINEPNGDVDLRQGTGLTLQGGRPDGVITSARLRRVYLRGVAVALDKYYLNLAGEYRVASELFKQGVFATITYGNRKGADIYAIGPNRKVAVIEVKASNSDRFVTSFYQKYTTEAKEHPDFWVLYSLKSDGAEEFFVLTHKEMAEAQAKRNDPTGTKSWEELAPLGRPRGVDNLLAKPLRPAHLSQWAKIVAWCSD
jgi:hypothetical protein